MELPGYRFYCHEQIKTELTRHSIDDSLVWLEGKISSGLISCIDDDNIIEELKAIYTNSAAAVYANMLRNCCDAYMKGYFEEYFKRVQGLNYSAISKEKFLYELTEDCNEIGAGKNLGELKSYVLLQMLELKLGEQIYVFCSDDRNARQGIISLGGARCISVLSSFMHLAIEGNMSQEEAKPYIQSFLAENHNRNQKTFRVVDTSKEMRFCKVPCEQVIEEMYAGKFEILQNGCLRYK